MMRNMRELIRIVEGDGSSKLVREDLDGDDTEEDDDHPSVEKFWINSRTGILEVLDSDNPEHETDLPGDGSLGFSDALAVGWVRGGVKTDGQNTTIYIMANTKEAARKAILRALDTYSADEVQIEWAGGNFLHLDIIEAERFGKTGRAPRI